MAQPTLVRNNRALVELSIPFDAGAVTTHIYVAAGPFETYRKRLSLPHAENPAASGESRHFWNHREFGFSDNGARYFVKMTTEDGAAAETPLESAPAFQVTRSLGTEPIPMKLKATGDDGVVLPNVMGGVGSPGEFIVSCRSFSLIRVSADVEIGTATFVEFQIETALERAGPFKVHQVVIPGAGPVDLKDALFRVDATRLLSTDLEIDQANFLRIQARSDAGVTSELGLEIERLARRAPIGIGAEA